MTVSIVFRGEYDYESYKFPLWAFDNPERYMLEIAKIKQRQENEREEKARQERQALEVAAQKQRHELYQKLKKEFE